MICKEEMINIASEASPSFFPIWQDFLEEWKDDKDLPIYIVLGDFARHINSLIKNENHIETQAVFSVIERWILEGDSYVKEATTVGLLEDLQNINVTEKNMTNKIESLLLPKSKQQWIKVNEFWEEGKLISE